MCVVYRSMPHSSYRASFKNPSVSKYKLRSNWFGQDFSVCIYTSVFCMDVGTEIIHCSFPLVVISIKEKERLTSVLIKGPVLVLVSCFISQSEHRHMLNSFIRATRTSSPACLTGVRGNRLWRRVNIKRTGLSCNVTGSRFMRWQRSGSEKI